MREEGLLLRIAQEQLAQASQALNDLESAEFGNTVDGPCDEAIRAEDELVYHLQRSLLSISTLGDRMGARIIAESAARLLQDEDCLRDTERIEDLHSYALAEAKRLLEPLSTMLGLGVVTGQDALASMLCSSAQIVQTAQVNVRREEDVRNSVLPVCRYIFHDAIREHTIPKIIKSSKADIAIPSLHTLIEFKLVKSKKDLVAALDGVSADMRNYCHPDWHSFYGVFYMPEPFFTQVQIEKEWKLSFSDKTWTPIAVLGQIANTAKTASKGSLKKTANTR